MLVCFITHTHAPTPALVNTLTHQQCLSYTDYGGKPVLDKMNVGLHREIRLMGIAIIGNSDHGKSDHGNRDHGNGDASDCTLSCHSLTCHDSSVSIATQLKGLTLRATTVDYYQQSLTRL